MQRPDYISQIDKVASEFVSKSYEDKLLNAWHSFEAAAKGLPREYDILDPNIPEEFFAQLTDFISLLYENQDGTPETDCEQIREKDAAYGGSWHARGGTGAFHALARKGDRIVSMMRLHKTLANCKTYSQGEAIDDTIGDLRRYLILVASWHWALPPKQVYAAEGPIVGLKAEQMFIDDPEPPPVKPCPDCKHPLDAHDEDGCNGLTDDGSVCGCAKVGRG